MNLGLAIFLSAVFLGTVALYIATMDRWNWKKIIIRPLLGGLLLVVLSGVGLLLWVYWPQAEKTTRTVRLEELGPFPLFNLAGDIVTKVPLGSSKADVRFLKGEPTETSKVPDRWRYSTVITGFKFRPPEGFEVENPGDPPGPHLLIYFNDGKVHAVLCGRRPRDMIDVLIQEQSQGRSTSPCGEAMSSNSEQITASYGEPSEIKRSKDELTRVYLFPERKEMFVLETNRVVLAGTYDPDVEAPSEFF